MHLSETEVPSALKRFFRAFDPQLGVVLETELWPNLCAETKRHGARLMLMNGRLSENSFRGYRKLPRLVRPMMAQFDVLAVQTPVEAERYVALGAWPERVHAIGSVKFDMTLDEPVRQKAAALRADIGARPVWIAASTHPGEDEQVLAAHRDVMARHDDALLVLVPVPVASTTSTPSARRPRGCDATTALCVTRSCGIERRGSGWWERWQWR